MRHVASVSAAKANLDEHKRNPRVSNFYRWQCNMFANVTKGEINPRTNKPLEIYSPGMVLPHISPYHEDSDLEDSSSSDSSSSSGSSSSEGEEEDEEEMEDEE